MFRISTLLSVQIFFLIFITSQSLISSRCNVMRNFKLLARLFSSADQIYVNEKKLIIGLGNPGHEYTQTKHNLGFMLLDQLKDQWNLKMTVASRFTADYGATIVSGKSVGVMKPLSFMNLSGGPVKKVMKHFQLEPSNILVNGCFKGL